jgi:Ca2+-binding EF-hand superfamily protein
MTKWHLAVIAAALAGAVTLGGGIVSTAWSASPGIIKSLDPDNDGTMDLNEAKAVAARVFDLLDRDKDGTLDRRELRARVSGRELAAADPDKDATLDKNEYMALVERRFKAADPDKDGTIDAKELRSRAGFALLHLLK